MLTIFLQQAPGIKVGSDAVPEFHLEAHPPGTAPKENTFGPNTESTIPGQALNPDMNPEFRTSATGTLLGATNANFHTGYGHPGSGQTSSELHGQKKKERSGLEGVGRRRSIRCACDRRAGRGARQDKECGRLAWR
jgi:hypothetical protein